MMDFVINDSNFDYHATNSGGPCGTMPRKTAYGASSVAVQVPLDVIPYEEWPDRISDQERNKSSLEHVHADSGMGVLMQGQLSYCWGFCSVGALMIERALMGLPFEMLSPSSVCAPLVGYISVGGYIENALQEMKSGGVASRNFVPMATTRTNDFKAGWREDAARHKVTIAKDIPRSHQAQGSQLLLNRPMPTGLNWWGHAVLFLRVLDRYPRLPANNPNRYGIKFLNSWDVTYGDRGFGILEQGRQVADQAYVLEQASFVE